MKIALITAGSRGDVQPYIALGKGLKTAGHDVRVVATDDFERLVNDAGLTFCSTGESVQTVLQSERWRGKMESGNFLSIQLQMRQELKHRAGGMATAMLPYCEDADLIIGGMGGLSGGFSVAEKLGIPIIEAHVFPTTPTREFPSPITPHLPFGNLLNRPSFHVARQILWQSLRIADVTTRQQLGLPPASFWGPFGAFAKQDVPLIYGYSCHVLPPPADWDDRHHITGYWFLDESADWTPPAALLDFLEAGDPPVYIGFGSMQSGDPRQAGQIALDALARSGQRGVIASGWGGLTSDDIPDSVYTIGSIPHSWLFPRMSAVVHHGGAGTTAAGLRAGVPSIIVPFMGDQPFWGKRVVELGVGPDPIPRKQLTGARLAEAIIQAVNDVQTRSSAAELGTKIRAENGIQNAVEIIQGEQIAQMVR